MSTVVIRSIEYSVPTGVRLHLDEPSADCGDIGWAIRIIGWASQEIVSLSAIADGNVPVLEVRPELPAHSEDAPPGAHAFYAAFSALELPCDFAFRLMGTTQDGSVTCLATISGTRQPLAAAKGVEFSPLILNCLGRVGSTWISALLGRHAELLAYRAFEFEMRTSHYWIEMFHAMSKPNSYFQPFAADLRNPQWWTGEANPGPVRVLPPDNLLKHVGGAGLQDLAQHCALQIDAFYSQVTEAEGKERARFFVEKTGHPFVTRVLRELYPRAKEVFLVRDCRDIFASMRHHFATPPHHPVSDEDLLAGLQFELGALLSQWEERRATSHLLRYEDLVQHPQAELKRLLSWLELEASDQCVNTILEAAQSARPDLQDEHRTATSVQHSVGRWQRDLPEDLASACDRALSRFNRTFGYLD